jgi:hypothetical protein
MNRRRRRRTARKGLSERRGSHGEQRDGEHEAEPFLLHKVKPPNGLCIGWLAHELITNLSHINRKGRRNVAEFVEVIQIMELREKTVRK